MNTLKCFDRKSGEHKLDYLVKLSRTKPPLGYTHEVVYRCLKCGDVFIDEEFEGQFVRHLRQIRFPEILGQIKIWDRR